MNKLSAFATVDPINGMNQNSQAHCQNLISGEWKDDENDHIKIPDPLNGEDFILVPNTTDVSEFIKNLSSCPKSGLHNPIRNVERYVMLGDVCAKSAELMRDPEIELFFAKLIQRVMPKSIAQCLGEVRVTRVFLENFAGDGVRFLARGFSNPGDHNGQESKGYRWPFGSVVVIAPFNFPLEIPVLQFMGALFMGNRPLVKSDTKVSIVFEQFLRMAIHCGLPASDADFIHCDGRIMDQLIKKGKDSIRHLQFTGSSKVAEHLALEMSGKIKIEDAGFDWKVIGPDFKPEWLDYVAWQCDEDAYNATGQKCSAQSILFVHDNWAEHLLPKINDLANRRNLENLTVGPILTWNNDQIQSHIDDLLKIDGASVLFGNEELENHQIPNIYGSIKPTAVQIPIEQLLSEHFELITTEVFGPFQIVIVYDDQQLSIVMDALERIQMNLTAAIVSNDVEFQQKILGNTVNGTTYAGMRARTTGAPQNHWFGPSGDPRSAGIGTPEAIINTWSSHREIIHDIGPIKTDWTTPESK